MTSPPTDQELDALVSWAGVRGSGALNIVVALVEDYRRLRARVAEVERERVWCASCEGSGRQIVAVGGTRSASDWPCQVCAGTGKHVVAALTPAAPAPDPRDYDTEHGGIRVAAPAPEPPKCAMCGGSGKVECGFCHGTGRATTREGKGA